MGASQRTAQISLRSGSEIPVRPFAAWQASADTRSGRIPLRNATPVSLDGHAPKAYAGEVVPFTVTAFREGHDKIGVLLRLISPRGIETHHRLEALGAGLDSWQTDIALVETGMWRFQFIAFGDDYATWRHAASLKLEAGVDVELSRELGARLFAAALDEKKLPATERARLKQSITALRSHKVDTAGALAVVRDGDTAGFFWDHPLMSLVTESQVHTLTVERVRAGVGSWYEFFPRSEGATVGPDGVRVSGTFKTAKHRLDGVAAMGFNVLYLPPIHPIGTINRKGPNNMLVAGEHDPGSPWAIGSAAGGHDTVHPDLGTEADFRAFVERANQLDIEIALDLALQAAPDHPWVAEHPDWFTTLPDGTIAYAENPPKKYQDIYPINFDLDPDGLRAEVLRVVEHWIALGVRIFRVDNPHTKPLQFWEWLIRTVNAKHNCDIVFLAEAFTRPALLQALAAAGFQQSYTYFTWRNTKAELEEFLTSVAHDTADFLRPNLFVNTPDILTEYLQFGGRAAFAIRAMIAATAAPTWGMYAGFELYENVARPGAEENIDSEKYELKVRDWAGAEAAGNSLAPLVTRLNEIRSQHPALQQLRNLDVHWSDDDAILVFSKHLDAALSATGEADTILVVANVDPLSVRETMVHVDSTVWGVARGAAFEVEDLLTGEVYTWTDNAYVRLDAFTHPVHIFQVRSIA